MNVDTLSSESPRDPQRNLYKWLDFGEGRVWQTGLKDEPDTVIRAPLKPLLCSFRKLL